MHINPTITIPITIGSYPILDEPPRYSTVNTIVPSTDSSINLNTNETDSNIAFRSALGEVLNNEQVVRPESIVSAFDDTKTTDVDFAAPYPDHGKSVSVCVCRSYCIWLVIC